MCNEDYNKDEERYTEFEINFYKYLSDKGDAFLFKAFELMAIISAGSFAVIASLSSNDISITMKLAMVLMIATVIQIVFVFFSEGNLITHSARKYIDRKQVSEKVGNSLKFQKRWAVATFCGSNLALLLTVLI